MSDLDLLWCAEERRNDILSAPGHPLNGVDYVEYARAPLAPPGQRHRLEVTFLKAPPAALIGNRSAFRVEGGIRIVGIQVLDVTATGDPLTLAVFVDREGDSSTYYVFADHAAIDPQRASAALSFKAGCPTEFDCRPRLHCEDPILQEPALDHLAKDYQSFRRLMMDLAPVLDPDFSETSPADLTITLIELFAYVGDYLSYFQDAAATEAFFDTCRQRISAARHALLIDQRLHAGRNAHSFVQFDGALGAAGVILAGTKLLTRVAAPLRAQPAPPGLVIPAGAADFEGDPALKSTIVFELAAPVRVIAARNRLRIHDWGDADCCLGEGARELFLYAVRPQGGGFRAEAPDLQPGEYILIEEQLGPRTGAPADADPRQRQVSRIELVEPTSDTAFHEVLGADGWPVARTLAADPAMPLLRVVLREADATRRHFRISAELSATGQLIRDVTIARANVAPADHGRTVVRSWPPAFPGAPGLPAAEHGVGRWPIDVQPLSEGSLTFQSMPAEPRFAPDGRLAVARHDLGAPAHEAMAAATVEYVYDGGDTAFYRPVSNLLGSAPFDAHFSAEVDNDGLARLRFGDDQYGRSLGRPVGARARYRIGNGKTGNIGADALVHVVTPDATDLVDPSNPGGGALPFPGLAAMRQPLSARDGIDPQSIDELKALAPQAFRAETYRAVTTADWEMVAGRLPGVAAARASFLWTGSWLTIFIALHPDDPDSLVRMPGGAAALEPAFAQRVEAALGRYKLAGYDMVVRAAIYVPIELEIRICVASGHFRGDVLLEAQDALSNRRLSQGRLGFFHPSRFHFGAPVYLSRLHAALMGVDGVESAEILVMKRYWEAANGELDRGLVPLGPDEVARLDNDPSQPEFGVLRLSAVGGL